MPKPVLFDPVASPYLVPFDDSFKIKKAPTEPDDGDNDGKEANVEALVKAVEKLSKLQAKLYARNQYSVLLVFQALDAAGKDGTIRSVLSGVNPAGTQVFAYKQPNAEELEHDFLWRVQRNTPERGRIGVWNRSHYEEVLVVRVHPEYLENQRLPRGTDDLPKLWEERYESINAAEKHWARNGCIVLKFFLNVSQKEQHKRFLDRVSDPANHWKFASSDYEESKHWDDYQDAYQDALRATSKPWAPWYCIPADSKHYMRLAVAEIVVQTMAQLDLAPPEVSPETLEEIEKVKKLLEKEQG
jgi:PPK2 family polyphosphate:nucleotide phosphotransferase